jgi:two-component system KDP operon response regulator KdpE
MAAPESPAQDHCVVSIGQLRIDVERRLAWMDGRPVNLSSHETGLLCCLAKHIGEPVSITELLSEVWECLPGQGGTAAQVKNCVLRLRKKLELDPKRPVYVITMRPRGYLLSAGVAITSTDVNL